MDYTIQKAVELGVNTIIPLMTEFSIVRLDPERIKSRLRHWKMIIISACEQCGRNLLPDIHPPTDLDSCLRSTVDQEKLVLQPGSAQTLTSVKPATTNVALICGSGGGIK